MLAAGSGEALAQDRGSKDPGAPLGPFRSTPRLSTEVTFDDNIYLVKEGRKEALDFALHEKLLGSLNVLYRVKESNDGSGEYDNWRLTAALSWRL